MMNNGQENEPDYTEALKRLKKKSKELKEKILYRQWTRKSQQENWLADQNTWI